MSAIVIDGSQDARDLAPVEELATAGGFEEREFVELFGADWKRCEKSAEQEDLFHYGHLFLWGTPPQLGALTAYADARLAIGMPRGIWPGPGELRYAVDDPTPVGREMPDEEIRDVVQGYLRRRRRSFGWCRYCGDRVAPEERFEPGVCYGCASAWYGIVY